MSKKLVGARESPISNSSSSLNNTNTPGNKINPLVDMAAEQFARILWEQIQSQKQSIKKRISGTQMKA